MSPSPTPRRRRRLLAVALTASALTVAALHARLAASFDLDAEPGALAARLDELVEAGLVEIL